MPGFETTISSRGQVVIPAELRQQLGLEKGTRATWIEDKGRLVLTPITEQRLDEVMGFLKSTSPENSMFEDSFRERQQERSREKK